MTRYECEDRLLALLEQAEKLRRDMEGAGALSMSCADGRLEIAGAGFAVVRFANGEIWRWDIHG